MTIRLKAAERLTCRPDRQMLYDGEYQAAKAILAGASTVPAIARRVPRLAVPILLAHLRNMERNGLARSTTGTSTAAWALTGRGEVWYRRTHENAYPDHPLE